MAEQKKQRLLFAGLDLGQSQDYTALAIIERLGSKEDDLEFNCTHLQRWQLRTPYPDIVADTVKIIDSEQMQSGKNFEGCPTYPELAIDATGVGAPIVDLFKRENMQATLKPVLITGGAEENYLDGVYRVPKRNLVSIIQVRLQQGKLKIAKTLADAPVLARELQGFQVKITEAANDTYGAWRDGIHDDLVLAVALAMWAAVNYSVGIYFGTPDPDAFDSYDYQGSGMRRRLERERINGMFF